MKPVFVPNYYPAFRCIASACRHTCCVGWEIDVDEDALEYYDTVDGPLGARLRDQIDREADPPCFRLDGEERCPFLNPSGLCELITELGEGALCRICADHPRFRNVLYDRVELGLGLCCEAVAALILVQTTPMEIILLSDGEAARERTAHQDTDEPDPLTDALISARTAILAAVQDRTKPLSERIRHVLHSLDIHLPMIGYAEWAEFLCDLERLDPARDGYLRALSTLEVDPSGESDPVRELDGETAAAYEQLVCYFLYRYLTAEDDGRPALLQVRVAFAVQSAILIHAIARATGQTSPHALAEVARLYSSEIEYSEENLERFLDLLEDESDG